MNIANLIKILTVLDLLGKMPMVGKGSTRPMVIFYSGVPDSTVHRYLDKAKTIGLVDVTYQENKNNQQVGYWKITNMGKGYILSNEMRF